MKIFLYTVIVLVSVITYVAQAALIFPFLMIGNGKSTEVFC